MQADIDPDNPPEGICPGIIDDSGGTFRVQWTVDALGRPTYIHTSARNNKETRFNETDACFERGVCTVATGYLFGPETPNLDYMGPLPYSLDERRVNFFTDFIRFYVSAGMFERVPPSTFINRSRQG